MKGDLIMSIASAAKILGSPKYSRIFEQVMHKGFAIRKFQVPNELLKQMPKAETYLKAAESLGYKNLHFEAGIKGGKNTVTSLLKAYSGKKQVGYLATGMDTNKAIPVVQARGQLNPPKKGEPIKFRTLLDLNKTQNSSNTIDFSTAVAKGHLEFKSNIPDVPFNWTDIKANIGKADTIKQLKSMLSMLTGNV